MYRIEQVLIPVDFSSFSQAAVAFGRGLGDDDGDRRRTRLQLAHAVESLSPAVRSVLFPYAPLGEDDREFEAEIIEATRTHLAEYFEFDDELRRRFIARPIVDIGSARKRISDWIGGLDVDLIAAGAFGSHGVFGAGPGSTSRRIVDAASCPVALLRDYEPRPTVDRILAAVDLGRDSNRVLEVAVGLAVDQGAALEVIHVIPTPFAHDTRWMVERDADIDPDAVEARLRPRAVDGLERLVEDLTVPYPERDRVDELLDDPRVAVGDPATEIGRRAEDGNFDLVVIGRGGSGESTESGRRRVASAVMAEVPKHLVVVGPEPEATPLSTP